MTGNQCHAKLSKRSETFKIERLLIGYISKFKDCLSSSIDYSVSRSLKKGQGATPKTGNFNARQPMSKGQPLYAATHVKQLKNMCQGQIKIFIITLIQFTVLIVFELWFDRVCINISYCFSNF